MRFSLIIPAYNEERRIGATLERATAFLADEDAEILVVDDGSDDGTAGLVRREFPSVRLISCPANRGKGHAVKEGMLTASGDFRAYYDADGSTPIEELTRAWPVFEAGADIVIGSRSISGSDVQVRQARLRETMGRGFNLLLHLLRLTRFMDTQCGFKVFTCRAVQETFPRASIQGFGFDAEILYIAAKRRLRIQELPVRWVNSRESRVRLLADGFGMLRDALVVRANALAGRYD